MLNGGGSARIHSLAAVPDDVVVNVVVLAVVIGLAFAACCTEKTLLAFATAPYAGRIMRVINAAKIAAHFPTATWNASLVDPLMLVQL